MIELVLIGQFTVEPWRPSDYEGAALFGLISTTLATKGDLPRHPLQSVQVNPGLAVGDPALQLEARLALGEIGLRLGNAATALKELSALQRDATARGFGLIAQKTSSLIATSR